MRWWPRWDWLPPRPWLSDVVAVVAAVLGFAALVVWTYWG